MTHFKVDIQIPIEYNLQKGENKRRKIPISDFYETYCELRNIVGGVHFNTTPVIGSWISPKKEIYDDELYVFTVIVESGDRKTVTNAPKIKKILSYKRKLKTRFKQEEMYILATRCTLIK